MWPWEHLAIGYLCFSLVHRSLVGAPPTEPAAIATVIGTQFPDLLDKPLGWVFHVLPSGLSLGHSLLFALPVSAVALLVTRRRDVTVGAGFATGYLLHLPADALYPVLLGGDLAYGFVLWPLGTATEFTAASATAYVQILVRRFITFLQTPLGTLYLGGELVLLAAALGLWIADGRPGLRALKRGVAHGLHRAS